MNVNYTIKILQGRKVVATGTLTIDPEDVEPEAGDSIKDTAEPADRLAFWIERQINVSSGYRAHIEAVRGPRE